MKVSGFTFIRNAILYDYPIEAAVRSILPLCDEVIVAVGKSEDATLDLVQKIDAEKIKIIETVWNDEMREGGRVLAEETNKAFREVSPDSDWAFYIQGDEVFHEDGIERVRAAMHKWKDNKKVDGLLFNYRHFYGSYDYVGTNSQWYPHEIRVIRNDKSIYSYQDAQGFRKGNNEKLRVKDTEAFIHHYGWVRPPEVQRKKVENFHKYWHSDRWLEQNVFQKSAFTYTEGMHTLERFDGTHPQLIQERIKSQNWTFNHDISLQKTPLKDRIKAGVKKHLGWDWSYRNYKLI